MDLFSVNSSAYSLASTDNLQSLMTNQTKIDIDAVMEAVGIGPQHSTAGDLPVLQDLNLPEITGQLLASLAVEQQSAQCVSSARGVLRKILPASQTQNLNMAFPSPPYSDPSSPGDFYSAKPSYGLSEQNYRSVSPPTPPMTNQPSDAKPISAFSKPPSAAKVKPPRARRSRPPSDKPSTPYMEMIARALVAAPGHSLILGDIYAYILQNYPYYREAPTTWKNAVRHNLTVNDCFMKAGTSKGGRGYLWAIHPACVEMFCRGDFRRMQARRAAQQLPRVTADPTRQPLASPQVSPVPKQESYVPQQLSLTSSQMSPALMEVSSAPYQSLGSQAIAASQVPHSAHQISARTPSPPQPPAYQAPIQMNHQQVPLEIYQQYFGNVDPYYFNQVYQQHSLNQYYNTMESFNFSESNSSIHQGQPTESYATDNNANRTQMHMHVKIERDQMDSNFDYKKYLDNDSPSRDQIKKEKDDVSVAELLGNILTAQ